MTSKANIPKARDGQNVGAVYERLRTAILHGEIAAGATVAQARLAGEFGAGRTPLREALRMLADARKRPHLLQPELAPRWNGRKLR